VLDAHRPLVVGFDLDMTLIDPRRSIRSALDALSEESGVAIDAGLVLSTLGPPLEVALAPWFDGAALERACRRFRQLHEPVLTDETDPMPGAIEAVGAVRALGGKTVVITAKYEPHARTSLQAVGIVADAVVGWRYGPEKGEALRDHAAQVYVGDHAADVQAARVGGVSPSPWQRVGPRGPSCKTPVPMSCFRTSSPSPRGSNGGWSGAPATTPELESS